MKLSLRIWILVIAISFSLMSILNLESAYLILVGLLIISIALKQKVVTIVILWITLGYGVWIMGSVIWLNLTMLGIAASVTIHLIRIKTFKPETELDEATVEFDPLEETS